MFAICSSVNGKMSHAISVSEAAVSEAGPPGNSTSCWDSMPTSDSGCLDLVEDATGTWISGRYRLEFEVRKGFEISGFDVTLKCKEENKSSTTEASRKLCERNNCQDLKMGIH